MFRYSVQSLVTEESGARQKFNQGKLFSQASARDECLVAQQTQHNPSMSATAVTIIRLFSRQDIPEIHETRASGLDLTVSTLTLTATLT